MQRYCQSLDGYDESLIAIMEPDPNGDWVKYEDVQTFLIQHLIDKDSIKDFDTLIGNVLAGNCRITQFDADNLGDGIAALVSLQFELCENKEYNEYQTLSIELGALITDLYRAQHHPTILQSCIHHANTLIKRIKHGNSIA